MAESKSFVGRRRRRRSVIGQAKVTTRIRTKFTDLNDDCLAHIFKYLNCNDIIKMFVVDTRLIDSACEAFKYVSSNVPLNIYLSPMDRDYMDPEDILEIVQNVGSLIRDIKMSGKLSDNVLDRRNDEEMQNITKYCSSVTDLKLEYIDTNIRLEYFQRFKELNKVKIHFSHLGAPMVQLQNVTHFHCTVTPELRRFRLCDSRQHYFQNQIPNMIEDDLLAFFNVNPQLKCVKLLFEFTCESQCYSDVVTSRFLQCIDKRLNVLEKLKLDLGPHNNNYTNSQNRSTYFRNLKKLVVNARGRFEDIFNYLAEISYVQLEELIVSATWASGSSLTAIQQCRNLRKLTLNFNGFQWTAADIIALVGGCTHLQYLHIKCEQNISPQRINVDFYKNICHLLRNRTSIKITLSIGREIEIIIDEETINDFNFNQW